MINNNLKKRFKRGLLINPYKSIDKATGHWKLNRANMHDKMHIN